MLKLNESEKLEVIIKMIALVQFMEQNKIAADKTTEIALKLAARAISFTPEQLINSMGGKDKELFHREIDFILADMKG